MPFQIGYTYPFPDLTQRFFTFTGLSYSQAMPILWRVLYTVEQIINNEGLDFNLSEFSHLYSLVSHGSHRFLFKAKPISHSQSLRQPETIPHGRINFSL
ncbi:hypothetical protein Hanom_Chr16g01456561 [Helianthus anomalus]